VNLDRKPWNVGCREPRNLRTPLAPTRVMGRMSVGALRVAFRTIVTDDALSGL